MDMQNGRHRFPFRRKKRGLPLFAFSVFIVSSVFFNSCSDRNDQLYSTEQANQKLLEAILVQDARCGQGHALSVPVAANVSRKELDLCINAILSTSCTEWGTAGQLPAACVALLVDLR